tara:strand:+ start:1174 stop:1800 length:627 start_codon:yes stop_codon:yes gene_type:complete
MSPREIYDSISDLFTDKGILVKGFKIKSKTPSVVTVRYDNDIAEITFGENQPRAEITKIITIYAYIEKIIFGPEGGSIKLRNFPDFSFGYGNEAETVKFCRFDNSDICNEIEVKYSKKSYKDIAKKCLQYSEEWATMCMGRGVTFDNADYFDRYTLKDQCYNFVHENIVEDAEKKYGSIILTWVFLYIILPTIIRWIINRFLDKLFDT